MSSGRPSWRVYSAVQDDSLRSSLCRVRAKVAGVELGFLIKEELEHVGCQRLMCRSYRVQ